MYTKFKLFELEMTGHGGREGGVTMEQRCDKICELQRKSSAIPQGTCLFTLLGDM